MTKAPKTKTASRLEKISEAAHRNHEELFPNHQSTLKVTDPELIELFDNFAFDEVIAQNRGFPLGLAQWLTGRWNCGTMAANPVIEENKTKTKPIYLWLIQSHVGTRFGT